MISAHSITKEIYIRFSISLIKPLSNTMRFCNLILKIVMHSLIKDSLSSNSKDIMKLSYASKKPKSSIKDKKKLYIEKPINVLSVIHPAILYDHTILSISFNFNTIYMQTTLIIMKMKTLIII